MKKLLFILSCLAVFGNHAWAQKVKSAQLNNSCSPADYFKSGQIMKSPGISSETQLYEIELFPEQEFTGYWYYWGSVSIGVFSITPKVEWLDIDPDTIKLTGDKVQPVAFHFKSPKQTGIYETDVVNTIWSTVHVKLTVTNLPISTSTYNVAKLDDSLTYKTRYYCRRWKDIGTSGNYFPAATGSYWWKAYPDLNEKSVIIEPNPVEIPVDSFRNVKTSFNGGIMEERMIQKVSEWYSEPNYTLYKQKKVNPKECVVSFDQTTNQYIKTNYYPTAKPITVMYWVKFTQLLADQTIGSHDANNHRVYLGINSSNNIYAGLGSGYTSSISSGITLNKWVHLALVGDGNNAFVYVNGKQIANFTYTFTGESTNDIYIGQRNYLLAPDSKLQGSIDEFQIWDKALIEGEIKNYMNNCPYGNEAGLALYYPFREGEGNFTKDFSSNSYTGFIPNLLNWPIDVPNENPKIKGIFKITPSMAIVGQDSITMEILGNKFNSQSKAYLIKADGSKYEPNKTIFKDSLHITLKFNFSRMNVGEYSLVVVNEINDTLKQENCFKLLNQELIPYGEWVPFKVNHGTVYASGVNVPSTEKLFVFVKKSSRTGYASTWKGKLRLLQDNEVIAQQTDDENYGGNIIGGSYSDFALQVPNAPSGLYTFEIDNLKENIQGEGEIMFVSTPPQLKLNQWDKGTILRAYGSDWKMVIVPKNVDILTIQTEGMGLWSTINVYYEDINQTANHWQFSNMGNGYTIKGIIKKPKSGVYFIKYMDSAVLQKDGSDNLYNHADIQSRDYMIYAGLTTTVPNSSQALSIEKLSTYTVGQGAVSIDISGTGFSGSDTIKLVKDNIVYLAEITYKDSRYTSATFDLTSANLGEYELKIINSKNEKVSCSNKVNIITNTNNEGFDIQILTRSKIRSGRWQNVIVKVSNNTLTDQLMIPLNIKLPGNSKLDFPKTFQMDSVQVMDTTININKVPIYKIVGDTMYLPLYIAHLSPKQTYQFEFKIYSEWGSEFNIKCELGNEWMTDKLIKKNNIKIKSSSNKYNLKQGDDCGNTCFDELVSASIDLAGKVLGIDDLLGCTGGIETLFVTQLYGASMKVVRGESFISENAADNIVSARQMLIPLAATIVNCAKAAGKSIPLVKAIDFTLDAANMFEHGAAVVKCYQVCNNKTETKVIDTKLELVNSTTPEDKYGPIGATVLTNNGANAVHYIDTAKVFEYRIDYWNKEDATAPAGIVYIRDTLDIHFNLQTLNFTEVGFLKWKVKLEGGQYFNVNVDCRPDMPYIVNIQGTVDPETREVYWVHKTLDPNTMNLPEDPMSGYLPPIDSSGYQIGWVGYTIKANPNLPDSTIFRNQAFVNFDGVGKWGPAPKEGPYTNIFDVSAPISKVSELPQTISSDSVLVKWKGTDKGCGLITYNIYVSKNGAGFEKWISTRDTLAWFRGVKDNTYEFYSIAIDDVGNTEVGKGKAEAITTMLATGISSVSFPEAMSVFPNPSQQGNGVHVVLNLEIESLRNGQLVITTLLGMVVKVVKLSEKEMVVSDIGNGMFIFDLRVNNVSIEHLKVIIQ